MQRGPVLSKVLVTWYAGHRAVGMAQGPRHVTIDPGSQITAFLAPAHVRHLSVPRPSITVPRESLLDPSRNHGSYPTSPPKPR